MSLIRGESTLNYAAKMTKAVRFVWFWTFWHWSRESFRVSETTQPPFGSVARLWNEWFNHEASAEDYEAIEQATDDEATQQAFVSWFLQVWCVEAVPKDNRIVAGYVLRALARVAPFDGWPTLAKYRLAGETAGVLAIVLEDAHRGRASDVREIEAILLPSGAHSAGGSIVPVGFKVDISELSAARQAVIKTFSGPEQFRLLAWWCLAGHRTYSSGLAAALRIGWVAVAGLIAWLRFGPEPGYWLVWLAATLLGLWITLAIVASVGAVRQIIGARRAGKALATHLSQDDIHLKVPGGLTLEGGSAGFAFCLEIMASTYRAYPHAVSRSRIFLKFFERLRRVGKSWAATGVVTMDGRIKPVAIEAKLRAYADHRGTRHLLVPRQRGASQRIMNQLRRALEQPEANRRSVTDPERASRSSRKSIHPCRNLGDAMVKIGRITSPAQIAINLLAALSSGLMVAALPNLWCILFPPEPPVAVAPSSPSPYFLWVSLETSHPEFFQVALESPLWANRHATVARHDSAPASTRAEIRLVRNASLEATNLNQGTIWIERRPYFLGRGFAPGERVGVYSVAYLNRLGY